jgi:hypothetical protein
MLNDFEGERVVQRVTVMSDPNGGNDKEVHPRDQISVIPEERQPALVRSSMQLELRQLACRLRKKAEKLRSVARRSAARAFIEAAILIALAMGMKSESRKRERLPGPN